MSTIFGIPVTQVANMLQNILMLVGGGLVTKGLMTGDQLSTIVAGIAALIVVVLNIFTHTQALATPVATPAAQ
jgi:hypothetical protein